MGEGGRQAAGRLLITDTWIDQKGKSGCTDAQYVADLRVIKKKEEEALDVWKLQASDHLNPKVLSIDSVEDVNATAETRIRLRLYWLCAASLIRTTIFAAAITSWCWGYEHGSSEELLTVHGYSVISVMAADSVSSPSRDWVSVYLIVSWCTGPGFPPCMTLYMMFLRFLTSSFFMSKMLCAS